MYCVNCNHNEPLKIKKVTRKFSESGLDFVILNGVEEYTCPKCAEVYSAYGDISQLHSLIANALIRKKDPLSGQEITFLRKYLGYSSSVFSEKIVGLTREAYSRIENGHSKVTPMLDHFMRLLVLERMPNRDYDLHDHFVNETGSEFERISFRYKKNEWLVQYA